jgi:hypothetical protein
MTAPYQARHRARHRAGSSGRRGAFNGPLTSAAAIVAVAGASAAGLASTFKPHTSVPSSTASQAAARAAAPRAPRSVVPASALAREAFDRARKASADRASRTQTREGILGRVRSDPQAAGRLLTADQGWGEKQFTCLDNLWTRESGWRWDADNPTSDAYGIAQSLPGSKMASVDSDWRTNPLTQIAWGLKYIANRYGTPCSAWSHWQGRYPHWY